MMLLLKSSTPLRKILRLTITFHFALDSTFLFGHCCQAIDVFSVQHFLSRKALDHIRAIDFNGSVELSPQVRYRRRYQFPLVKLLNVSHYSTCVLACDFARLKMLRL